MTAEPPPRPRLHRDEDGVLELTGPNNHDIWYAREDDAVELTGPDDKGWYTSHLRDWIPLCPDLKDSAIRLYWILRALVIDKYGPVRKLTLMELCRLLPTASGKPSSLSRVRGLLADLSRVGLISTPEGGPVTTSSRAKRSGALLRLRINDLPSRGYSGPRNAFAALDMIKPAAAQAADAATAEEAQRNADRRTRRATGQAGQKSDPHDGEGGAGQISGPRGQIFDPRGQIFGPDPGSDQEKRDPPFSPTVYSSRSDATPDAVGPTTGGFARACDDPAADSERASEGADGPGAAHPPRPGTAPRRSPRPRVRSTQPRVMPDGYDIVRAAVPAEIARPGTLLWVGLRRAIADLLTGNPTAGIPARTPEQVITRINSRWKGERGPERSAPGYTPATTSPADQPIRSRSAWLANAILWQDCADPRCEDGLLITTNVECLLCREHREETKVARRVCESAGQRMQEFVERQCSGLTSR